MAVTTFVFARNCLLVAIAFWKHDSRDGKRPCDRIVATAKYDVPRANERLSWCGRLSAALMPSMGVLLVVGVACRTPLALHRRAYGATTLRAVVRHFSVPSNPVATDNSL